MKAEKVWEAKIKMQNSYDGTFFSVERDPSYLYDKAKSRKHMNFSYVMCNFDFEKVEDEGIEVEELAINLQEIYVQEELRGTGYSKKLMSESIKKISDMGKKIVYLDACEAWCNTSFDKLKRFYESFGFVQMYDTTIFKLAL